MSKGYKELSFKINAELNPDSVAKIQKVLDNKQATINLNLDFKDLDSTLKKLNSKLDKNLSSGTEKLTTGLKTSKLTAEQLSTSLQSLSRIKIDKALADLDSFKLKNGTSDDIEKSIANLKELKSAIANVKTEDLTFKKYSDFKNQIQDITAKITTFKKETKLDVDTSKLESSIKGSYNKLEDTLSKMKGELSQLDSLGFDTSKFKASVSEIATAYKNIDKDKPFNSIASELTKVTNDTDKLSKKISSAFDEAKKSSDKLYDSLQTLSKTKLDKSIADLKQFEINNGTNEGITKAINDLENLRKEINKVSKEDLKLNNYEDFISKINKLTSQVTSFKKEAKLEIDTNNLTISLGKSVGIIAENISKIKAEIKKLEAEGIDTSKHQADLKELENAFERIDISKHTKDTASDMKKLESTSTKVANGVTKDVDKMNKANLKGLQSEIKRTDGFFREFINNFSAYSLADITADLVQDGIRTGIDSIMGVDAGLNEIMMVAPPDFRETEDNLEGLKAKIFEIGKATGQTFEDTSMNIKRAIMSGISDMDTAIEVGNLTSVLSNISELSQEEASSALVSLRGAFQMTTEELANGVDQLNHAGNNYSSATGEVSNAIAIAGGTLNQAGNSFNESIGMFLAGNHTLQDGNKVANGLKTIATNLKGVSYNAKSGKVELNKVGKALKNISGIDVYSDKSKTKVKSTYELMSELHKKWTDGSLNQTQKLSLAETIAGKHRLGVLQSMIDNWEIAKQYQDDYNEGSYKGSAEKENTRFTESLAGKLNRLKISIGELFNTLVDSGVVGGILDGISTFIEKLTVAIQRLSDSGNLLPTLVAGFQSLSVVIKALAGFGIGSFVGSLVGKSGGLTSVASGLGAIATKGGAVSKLLPILASSFTTLGVAAATGLVGYSVVKGLSNLKKEAELYGELQEEVKETIAVKEDELKSLQSVTDKELKRYDELNKKRLEAKKNNKSLSKDELSEYQSLVNKIGEVAPELVKGYDELGNAILIGGDKLGQVSEDFRAKTDQVIAELEIQKRKLAKLSFQDRNQERSRGAFLKKETYDESMERSIKNYVEDTHKAELNLSKASEKLVKSLSKSDNLMDTTNALNKYSQSFATYSQKLESNYLKHLNDYDQMAESRANLQTYMKESLELSDAYANLVDISKNGTEKVTEENKKQQDKIKKNASNTINTLKNLASQDLIDWSGLNNQASLDSVVSNITSSIGENGEIPNALTELEKAYAKFGKDKNIDNLRLKLSELKPAIIDSLGMSEAEFNKVFQIPKYLQLAEDGLDDYLQRRGSDAGHLSSTDKALKKRADELKKEYNSLEELVGILTDESNYSLDGKFFNEKELLRNFTDNSNLSDNVRNALEGLFKNTNGINIPVDKLGLVIDHISATEIGNHNSIEDALQYMINLEESGYPVKINLEPFFENSTNLSQEYKDMINQLGELSKEDANAVLNITGKLQLDKEIDLRDAVYLQQVINDQLGENTIDILAVLNDEQFNEESRQLLERIQSIAKEQNIELTTNLDTESLNNIRKELSLKEKDLFDKHIEVPISGTIKPNFSHVEEVANELNRTPINLRATLDDSELLLLDKWANVSKEKTVNVDADTTKANEKIDAVVGLPAVLKVVADDNGTADQVKQKVSNMESDKTVDVNVTDNGTSDEVKQKANNIGPINTVNIPVSDNGSINKVQSSINSIKGKTVEVTVKKKEVSSGLSGIISSVLGGAKRSIDIDTPPQVARMSSLLSVDTASAYSDVATFTDNVQSRVNSMNSEIGTNAVSPMARASKWTPSSILTGSVDYLKYSIDLQQELEAVIDNLSSRLEILAEKFDLAYGKDKIKNLEEQNKLLKEQMSVQKKLETSLKKEQSDLKKFLSGKGIKFDKDGNTTNWVSTLTKLEKEVASLEAKANKTGKTADERAYEKKKQYLDDLKKAVERYTDITSSELPKAQEEWLALQNAINSNLDEIEELKANLVFDIELDKLQILEAEFEQLGSKLDIINSKLEYANGEEKVELLQKQLELLKKQAEVSLEIQNQKIENAKALKEELAKEGFKFDEDGLITNYEKTMKKLEKYVNASKTDSERERREEEIEKIKDSLEEYLDLVANGIPDAQKEWLDLQNSIKDTNKEMLEITKDIEDKITDVYKKEVEERKKLIQDELDKRLEALDKQKEAYNKSRDEQDKAKEIDEQQKVLDDLQKKIIEASKDNSTSGKANFNKLMEEYQSELEKMEDIIQKQTDDKINDLFDKQKELLEQQAKLEEERLDDKYSDENLKQIVKEVITSGEYTDLNGEVKKLEDVLISFVDKYEDGMSAVGDVIKHELLANLKVAKETMQDMTNILEELNLTGIKSATMLLAQRTLSMPELSLTNDNLRLTPTATKTINTTSIQFNAPLVHVTGNVSDVYELDRFVREAENRITTNILKHMR